MKHYNSTPNFPKYLNDSGKKYFRNLSNRMITKDNLTPYTKYHIGLASFIYQKMETIEKNDVEDMKLYLELSRELRKIEDRLFNLSTIKEDLLQS